MILKFYKKENNWVFSIKNYILNCTIPDEIMEKLSTILEKDVIYVSVKKAKDIVDDYSLWFYSNQQNNIIFSKGLVKLSSLLGCTISRCINPLPNSIAPWTPIQIKDIY